MVLFWVAACVNWIAYEVLGLLAKCSTVFTDIWNDDSPSKFGSVSRLIKCVAQLIHPQSLFHHSLSLKFQRTKLSHFRNRAFYNVMSHRVSASWRRHDLGQSGDVSCATSLFVEKLSSELSADRFSEFEPRQYLYIHPALTRLQRRATKEISQTKTHCSTLPLSESDPSVRDEQNDTLLTG